MLASVNHPINCGLATTSSFARQFAKRNEAGFSFEFDLLPRVLTAGQTPQVVIAEYAPDTEVTRSVNSSGVYDMYVNVEPEFVNEYPYEYGVDDASIFGLARDGDQAVLQYKTSGSSFVSVTSRVGETVRKQAVAQTFEGTTTDVFSRHVPGTAIEVLSKNVLDRAIGSFEAPVYGPSFPNGRLNMLVPPGPYAQNGWTRNPNFWLADIDWTCLSIRNSRAHNRAGTLISPRYAVCASHFPLLVGDTITFLSEDNTPVIRTVESVTDYQWPLYDTLLMRLSSPITYNNDGVKFCKVMPSNWLNYLPGLSSSTIGLKYAKRGVAGVSFNQDKMAGATAVTANSNAFYATGWPEPGVPLGLLNRYQPSLSIRIGDSGHPVFLVANDEPVLVGTWTSVGSGLNFTGALGTIYNQIMSADGEAVAPVDLSGFTNFAE
jgi:hypothetical protein